MLPAKKRLPSTAFRGGQYRAVTTPYFSLKRRTEGDREGGRIGVVVNSAVHKSAAHRNFWKRQAKAALMKLSSGQDDLLMMLFPKVNTLTKKQFQALVRESASRMGIAPQ